MPNKQIFCSVPWISFHMYRDGSFGMCCMEKHKTYKEVFSEKYNIQNMTVSDWYNSDIMKQKRLEILGNKKLTECKDCYSEENYGHESKRHRENLKTVIFKDRIEKSYQQSHWFERFESAKTWNSQEAPIDWHIDLGNECNLACKMCNPNASSKIASYHKKWNILDQTFINWTNDKTSYNNFLKSLDNSKIHNIHFIGGEPFYNKKFKEIINHLVLTNRHDVIVSFATNGTTIDLDVIEKLKMFQSVSIEISIESIKSNNHYIRQGSVTEQVKNNILFLNKKKSKNTNIILRTVPQLLSINTYHELILWAWENKLPIISSPLLSPSYLAINVLPVNIRQLFITEINKVIDKIKNSSIQKFKQLSTSRDISRLDLELIKECESLIRFLIEPEPADVKTQRKKLAEWLFKWDEIYNLNPFEIYPEYTEFLKEIEYGKI